MLEKALLLGDYLFAISLNVELPSFLFSAILSHDDGLALQFHDNRLRCGSSRGASRQPDTAEGQQKSAGQSEAEAAKVKFAFNHLSPPDNG
jgi:hypothetical protein